MTSIVSPSLSSTVIDKKTKIESTEFTVDFVLEHVRNVSGNVKLIPENLYGISVVDITGGSAFFAKVLKVSFDWNDSLIEPKSVVLKIPIGMPNDLFGPKGFPEFMEVLVPNIAITASDTILEESSVKSADKDQNYLETAHTREVQFYACFANHDNDLHLPTFYYGYEYSRNHQNGVLVMEDLSRAGSTLNILPGLNNAQIENLIDELARLAAFSWKDRSWVSPMLTDPDREEFIDMMREMSLELKKSDERFDGLLDRLAPLYKMKYIDQCNYKEDKYGFPSALVHGDLWAPNIIWNVDENRKVKNELNAIIDWQAVHAGNPLEDFGRLLSLNTTSKYRRENHDRLLGFYLSKLREYCEGECPINEQNIHFLYKMALPYVMMFLGFGAPMYCNMPSVVRHDDPEHKAADTAELLDRVFCFFEEVAEAYDL